MKTLITTIAILSLPIIAWIIAGIIVLLVEWYKHPLTKPFRWGGVSKYGLFMQFTGAMMGILAILLSPLVWVYKKLRGKE